ncbi:MAG: glycosyltransferase family 39 protein [Candidatus Niyogibacteria bacterium]|nr:glycosyltransferase family 39 protein [Candidatus Niyogibacteria bacterium]
MYALRVFIKKHRMSVLLVLILAGGSLFRLWGLGSAELIFDEGLYAFRSIGYLDYLESPSQQTPIQWLKDSPLPFWTVLSFHDHPMLFFGIQYVFFSFFGDSLFMARLPSALAGIASLFLIFLIVRLIGKRLGSNKSSLAGLIAASTMAVAFSHVAVSRLSIMEGVLFFFILTNIYFFLRFEENKKYWVFFGITLGLSLLTKYTAVFLLPVYISYLLITKSPSLKQKYLYLSFIVAIIVFSPAIIYNILFFNAFGHFDLQLSYLLGQETPGWQGEGGKTQDPFGGILTNLLLIYTIPFLILFLGGVITALIHMRRNKVLIFMLLVTFFMTVLFVFTGSAVRFISFYIIPASFFIPFFFIALFDRFNKAPAVIGSILILFFFYEIFFSVRNTFIATADYGIVKLDHYFESAFKDSRPEGLPQHPNPHLNRYIQEYGSKTPGLLDPVGIIYDDRITTPARLWLFSKRQYYHGIPTVSASAFVRAVQEARADNFAGFEIYFVKTGPATVLRAPQTTEQAEYIEKSLKDGGIEPEIIIKGLNDAPAFYVYRFSF